MGRLISLPDKEEVPGSNPGAPTTHLQGVLPLTPPLRPPAAILLQPKCSHTDGTERDSSGLAVTGAVAQTLRCVAGDAGGFRCAREGARAGVAVALAYACGHCAHGRYCLQFGQRRSVHLRRPSSMLVLWSCLL